ncbi:hypothetical protein E1B28_008906 [Marasmius oreades]|uniref:Mediator complex subunit 16 n=1 Tax=Marasmius oreades TaxID=181124 RepID=A0A9P7RZY6_9AGAR|nr:uncharacterized protein E1B28_008906 [Marasmius oreades]KAG7092557.1 hypothetical protein E1B28_008906 [Marasmius oreades]
MREDSSWQAGWYDIYPALEHPRRPIEWSNSSIIFTGYGMQPAILARHFSSSKQFIMPSPPPLLSEPDNYGPATVISVSPDDAWLFACFPGQNNAGVCCLWNRGPELDNWRVMDWWTYPAGAGVVVADWIGAAREWVYDSVTESPRRLPFRGPRAPVSHPTLVFVTENHQIVLCYVRHYSTSIKMLSCSLLQQSNATEPVSKLDQEPTSDINSIQTCVSAAISLNFSDPSIIVATRSQKCPLPLPTPQFNHMDLGLTGEPDESGAEALDSVLEDYEEHATIELCEVQLKFDGLAMSLSTRPLPVIQTAERKLKDLHFIVQPPTRPSPSVHLVASFFDFYDYVSLPTAEVVCYSLTRQAPTDPVSWICKQECSRSFEDKLLAFLAPCKHLSGTRGVTVGVYRKSSAQPHPTSMKAKDTVIGSVSVLKVPDLTDDQEWEALPILKPNDKVGQDVSVSAVVSPNCSMLCTMSASIWATQTTLQRAPQIKAQTTPPLSVRLVIAVLSEHATTDITHQLSHHTISSNIIGNILCHSFSVLDAYRAKTTRSWLRHLGIALEVYRMRASRTHDEQEKEDATSRWKVAQDVCSLTSCNVIFNECRDGEGYNLDTIWQLVGLCTWIMDCLEKIMKECVLSLELSSSGKTSGPDVSISPTLLMLLHPHALQTLLEAVANVKQVRQRLELLTPRSENSQIARDAFIDQVDCSSINLTGLLPILKDVFEVIKITSDEEIRRCLALCQPTENMRNQAHAHLLKVLEPGILDRSRLFMKLHDFVDGMSRLAIEPQKQKYRDIVTKNLLLVRPSTFVCVRCGGQSSELGKSDASTTPKLVGFIERYWIKRCVCGGPWIRAPRS